MVRGFVKIKTTKTKLSQILLLYSIRLFICSGRPGREKILRGRLMDEDHNKRQSINNRISPGLITTKKDSGQPNNNQEKAYKFQQLFFFLFNLQR